MKQIVLSPTENWCHRETVTLKNERQAIAENKSFERPQEHGLPLRTVTIGTQILIDELLEA